MTKAEAIERCGKALVRKQGYNDQSLDQYPGAREKAEDLVICLIELGLLQTE
jgi:hypothetical protein